MFLVFKENLQTQPLWLSFTYYLGLYQIIVYIIYFLKWTFISFLKPSKNLTTSYGSWALITGSSDGIGRPFAFQLASHGFNLILVSRDQTKLELVLSEIKQKFPETDIRTVTVDFSEDKLCDTVREIEKAVEGLDVGFLVNNVGIAYPKAMYFHEVNEEVWMKIVRVNIEATTGVTKAVLPGMIMRRKGAIVNIGSGAAVVVPSHPLFAIYAATKAFVDQFSRSLHVEYKNLGIDVQCQVPLYVATKMASRVAKVQGSSMFVPTAEDYAAAAVRWVGYRARCCPYWGHALQWCATSLVPKGLLDAWRLFIGIQRRSKDPLHFLKRNGGSITY